MSQEISVQASLKITKNGAVVGQSFSQLLDMSGDAMVAKPQSIATSSTAITFGDISGAPKKVVIKNLDATNYVEVDSASSFDKFPQKVLPGDTILLSPQTGTIYAKAHTSAVLIFVIAAGA